MSGAAGHMNHLYDNSELSFDEMISIMKSASRGKIEGTEKLDGVNVFLGYNGGTAKAARNEGDIAKGGLDLEAVIARDFAGGDVIRQVYVKAVKAFDLAVQSLSDDERINLFGAKGEKFYNSEILHTDAKNIISYSGDVISIHRQGHKELNSKTGEVELFDAASTAKAFDQVVNKFEIQLSGEDNTYKFRRAAVQKLKELSNKEDLQIAIAKINKAVSNAGVSTGDTVGTYLKAMMRQQLTNIPEEYLDIATARMTGELMWRTPEINGLPKDVKKALSQYWKQAKPLLEKIIFPIEEAVHEFAVAMLEGMESAFIIDNRTEVDNIKKQVSHAKKQIESYVSQGLQGAERANEILTKQMAKLKDVENIDTASEGFVFEHDGILYKFTGSFAPVNQILNLYKWGRGKQVPPISQQLEDTPDEELQEVEAPIGDLQRVAVVPGGFKPPHAGHFQGAEWFLNGKKKDEENNVIEPADIVYVLISPKSRMGHAKDGRDGRGVEITKEMSKQLWDLYIKENGLGGKMKAEIVKGDNPVKAAYEFMQKLRPGQTLILGKGAKDASDKRFDGAQAWSDKNGYELNVEVVDTPMMAGGVSGTDMRRHIADQDYENFAKYIPLTDATAAWQIVRPDLDTQEELEEISAMSAGSVEGASASADGKKKKAYSVWERSEFTQELINELKQDTLDVINLDHGLQLTRSELPQIKSTDVQEFIKWLREEQNIATETDTINPADLTPIQKEINLDKVAGMVANKGLEALSTDKPVMISGDDYLIDGHHRWYALLDAEHPTMDIVRIGMSAKDLISVMKTWSKASYKSTVDEKLYEFVLKYIKESQSYEQFRGEKFVLDLKDMSVVPTKHGEERRSRHKQNGKGMKISKDSIVKAIDKAMGNVMNDFMNGELGNDEPFLIRAKQGSQPTLNVVCALKMKKGPDSVNIITVMRKEDFKTDNFGAQKEYAVSI